MTTNTITREEGRMQDRGGKAAPCRLPIDQLLAIHLGTCCLPANHAGGHMFIRDGMGGHHPSHPCDALPTAEWKREQKAECVRELERAA